MAVPDLNERSSKTMTPRRLTRHRVETLAYAYLGPGNGGFPIDLSEDGAAFQGVLPLQKDQSICIAFKLDGVEELVAANARIVWLTDSRKGGGLQFVRMTEFSRHVIQQWISLRQG